MSRIKFFIIGMYEFRRSITTGQELWSDVIAYDRGREWAHRLTLRYWDN